MAMAKAMAMLLPACQPKDWVGFAKHLQQTASTTHTTCAIQQPPPIIMDSCQSAKFVVVVCECTRRYEWVLHVKKNFELFNQSTAVQFTNSLPPFCSMFYLIREGTERNNNNNKKQNTYRTKGFAGSQSYSCIIHTYANIKLNIRGNEYEGRSENR